MLSFLHPILTINIILTGTQQDDELDKRHEKCNTSPAKQYVHHAGEWASQVEAVNAHEPEEEAQKNGGNFALGVNLLLRSAVWAIGR